MDPIKGVAKASEITQLPSSQTITLTLRNDKDTKKMQSEFKAFQKPDLLVILKRFITVLRNVRIEYVDSDVLVVAMFKKLLRDGGDKLFQKDLVQILAALMADVFNILGVVDALLPHEAALWRKLVTTPYLLRSEARAILGREVVTLQTTRWPQHQTIEVPLLGADFKADYYDQRLIYLYLSPVIRRLAAIKFLHPDEYLEKKVSEAELPDNVKIVSFESTIASDLSYLTDLEECGELVKWPTGSITQAGLKTLARNKNIPAFEDEKGESAVNRGACLGLAYALFVIKQMGAPEASAQTLRDFSRFVRNDMGRLLEAGHFSIFFPEYKGFTKTFTNGNQAQKVHDAIFLMLPREGEWLDVSNIHQRYLFAPTRSSTDGFIGLFSDRGMSSCNLRLSSESTTTRTRRQFGPWTHLTRPYIYRYLKMLCACGIVDLAIDPEAPGNDPTGGIRYVRLTDLGKYSAYYTDSYTPKEGNVDRGPVFDFDDRNHIITLLDPESPYGMYLKQIGRQIGGNRFHVSAETIVKGVTDTEDANHRIQIFRTKICPEPKGYWQEMLDEINERLDGDIGPIARYLLIRLNDKAPGILEYVATHPLIRKHTLKAEKNHLLVEQDFFNEFQKLMHEGGYLIS